MAQLKSRYSKVFNLLSIALTSSIASIQFVASSLKYIYFLSSDLLRSDERSLFVSVDKISQFWRRQGSVNFRNESSLDKAWYNMATM